jgi:DNA-binding HxlR family transcriptional regulator
VSQKTLAQTLRELTRDGPATRTVLDGCPPQVEYAPTDRGRGLLAIARALKRRSEEDLHGIAASCAAFEANSATVW